MQVIFEQNTISEGIKRVGCACFQVPGARCGYSFCAPVVHTFVPARCSWIFDHGHGAGGRDKRRRLRPAHRCTRQHVPRSLWERPVRKGGMAIALSSTRFLSYPGFISEVMTFDDAGGSYWGPVASVLGTVLTTAADCKATTEEWCVCSRSQSERTLRPPPHTHTRTLPHAAPASHCTGAAG